MLFAKGGRRGSGFDSKTKQSTGTKFEMLVEDITEGVLVSLDSFSCYSIIVVPYFIIWKVIYHYSSSYISFVVL